MANKALVYAIYPNEKQNIQCQKTFGCCRFVYNQMLTVQKERHEKREKHLSKTKANTYCNQHLKKSAGFPSIRVSTKRKNPIQQISQTGISKSVITLLNCQSSAG